MNDRYMDEALAIIENRGLKDIMTFHHPWNSEVIAQFYSTLWIEMPKKARGSYRWPYLHFNIQGEWYKCSYRRFAYILGFTDSDISKEKVRCHEYDMKPIDDIVLDMHLDPNGKLWVSSNMKPTMHYLNHLFRATVVPKGGNATEIRGVSRAILWLLHPENKEASKCKICAMLLGSGGIFGHTTSAHLLGVIGDTCVGVAMDEWVVQPQGHTALDDILPCIDTAPVTAEALRRSEEVNYQLVSRLNQLLSNVSNANVPPQVGPPAYYDYNQSGPLVPLLYNPYNANLSSCRCAAGEVTADTAQQVWQCYVCRATAAPVSSGQDVCATVGRLTPAMYSLLLTAASVSDGLRRQTPALAETVHRAFQTMIERGCPSLRRDSSRVYQAMLAAAAWVVHSRERRRRREYERFWLGRPDVLGSFHHLHHLAVGTDFDGKQVAVIAERQLILLPVQRHPVQPSLLIGPHIVQVGQHLGRVGLGSSDPVSHQLARPCERDDEVGPVSADGDAVGTRPVRRLYLMTRPVESPVVVTIWCCARVYVVLLSVK
ncbi:LOW QUALITY PROTEIN: hypothetical protein U9M48_009282 [Paspalum notatum var. saurae]|uniref:Uncharacterized protein n=1 Tax=Paspalum notatum var. saurae TaxID=547442 RepID=A0AAQ3WER5_PASNO